MAGKTETKPIVKLLTTGRIAWMLDEPVARVAYVLATRPHIQPAAMAGNARLYNNLALAQVRHELNAIDARRCRTEQEDTPCA